MDTLTIIKNSKMTNDNKYIPENNESNDELNSNESNERDTKENNESNENNEFNEVNSKENNEIDDNLSSLLEKRLNINNKKEIPLDILQKIFTVKKADIFLKIEKPELYGKKNNRCRKDKYLGDKNKFWEDIQKIDPNKILNFTRNHSINNDKYQYIHNNLEWVKETLKKTNISKEKSPCQPEQFSESVVKPNIRKRIQLLDNDIIENCMKDLQEPLRNHVKERINQQLKADYSEYIIMMNCPKIIPTLHHTKGVDMYLLNDDNTIEKLDIKTTRSVFGITEPANAIKKLYEKQGSDRFSASPRLYIYLSNNEIPNKEDIENQLNKKYNIKFSYDNIQYNVEGARIIFI